MLRRKHMIFTALRTDRDMRLAATPFLELVEHVMLNPRYVYINDTAVMLADFENCPWTSSAATDLVRRSLNRQLAEFHGVQ